MADQRAWLGRVAAALMSFSILLVGPACYAQVTPSVPSVVPVPQLTGSSQLLLSSDGMLRAYTWDRTTGSLVLHSSPNGRSWSTQVEPNDEHINAHGAIFFSDEGREAALWLKRRCVADCRKPNRSLFYDIMLSERDGAGKWQPARSVYRGYVGAIRQMVKTPAGQWLLPFAEWIPEGKIGPPTGSHVIRLLVGSPKMGWRVIRADLTTPVPPQPNAPGFGGIEPAIARLNGGGFLMLIRTQTQYLYQATSGDGVEWSIPKKSVLQGSSAPAYLLTLRDGRIVAIWNNEHQRGAYKGRYVYGGRDALHAAISRDDGKTWRGFREIYRDPLINRTPPLGDFGTGYPSAVEKADGRIEVLTGQGKDRLALITFDPTFLEEPCAASGGLSDSIIAFREFGPVRRSKRARSALLDQGGEMVQMKMLGDEGALQWNFPAAYSGELSFEVSQQYTGSLVIGLTDRLMTPGDTNLVDLREYSTEVSGLLDDTWRTVSLHWDNRTSSTAPNMLNYVNISGHGSGAFALRNLRMCGRH